ncbi:MAG: glutamyl-tRNA reductase [Armatimonadota bacterium]
MHLVLIGISYKTSPIELRERLNIAHDILPEALASLKAINHVSECVILSTCNRTEIYAYTVSRADDVDVIRWLGEYCGVPSDDFASCIYSHAGHKAVEHLFRVASGIDSMILGEDQILGQIKDAYSAALDSGTTGAMLNTLFQKAIETGKRSRYETEINRGMQSVGSAAVQLIKSHIDELEDRVVMIVGAGKVAKLAAAHLSSCSVKELIIANRTYEKAHELAESFGGRAIELADMPSALSHADVVLTSCATDIPFVTRQMVSAAMDSRQDKPMMMVDIGVPGNIESQVADIDNVSLYNIDDLQCTMSTNTNDCLTEVAKVEAIIEDEVAQFLRWYRIQDTVPVIISLREKLDSIHTAEFEKLSRKLPGISAEDMEIINKSMRSIINKVCHQPMIQIKEYAVHKDAEDKLRVIRETFGLNITETETGES